MTEASLTTRATQIWAVALTGASLFMITLDNLIVLSTLPSMQRDLGVSVDRLQWVVDAYILSFAVLMLTGAALGDRYGRRRMLVVGLLVFYGVIRCRRTLERPHPARRRARRPGRRGRVAHAAHADVALGGLPARATHGRARAVVVHRRARRGAWAGARRSHRRDARLALDLLDQRAGRTDGSRARSPSPDREPRRPGAARPARPRATRAVACSASCGRRLAAMPTAGARPRRCSRTRWARRSWARSSRRSGAPLLPCCRSPSSADPASRPPTPRASGSTSRCSRPSS